MSVPISRENGQSERCKIRTGTKCRERYPADLCPLAREHHFAVEPGTAGYGLGVVVMHDEIDGVGKTEDGYDRRDER